MPRLKARQTRMPEHFARATKIAGWLSLCVPVLICGGAVAPGDDYNANTQAAAATLQRWYNNKGLWDSTGWWNAANCLEAVESAIATSNGGNYLPVLSNTFNLNATGNFLNDYY